MYDGYNWVTLIEFHSADQREANKGMHKPNIIGYEIQPDGKLVVTAKTPEYTNWADRGTKLDATYNTRNTKGVRLDSILTIQSRKLHKLMLLA